MLTFNLPTLLPESRTRFDHLFRMFDQLSPLEGVPIYPPYNIERIDENTYRITIAVAGFTDDDLKIELKDNQLAIRGSKEETSTSPKGEVSPKDESSKTESRGPEILYRGIVSRSFERRFQLANNVLVEDARLEHGLLTITLKSEIPETKKPRQIPINRESSNGSSNSNTKIKTPSDG